MLRPNRKGSLKEANCIANVTGTAGQIGSGRTQDAGKQRIAADVVPLRSAVQLNPAVRRAQTLLRKVIPP